MKGKACLFVVMWMGAGFQAAWAETGSRPVTVRLVDSEGQAVMGASVGARAFRQAGAEPIWRFYGPQGQSDNEGLAMLRIEDRGEPQPLYVLHEERQLAGFAVVSPDQQLAEAVEIKLLPACRVSGRIASSELETLGREVEWTNVYLLRGEDRPLGFSSYEQEFEFYLPPGEYRLWAYGTHLRRFHHEIEVEPGQSEMDLGVLDLPATRLVKLFGKPAPELQQIKAWRNGEPVTVEELRGKVVILDFWGYWCGPCVAAMPALMSLHDDYHAHGLVIIGVHDDSVADGEELDEHLARLRDENWQGREIPFRVALDGGGITPIEGTEVKTRGATTAAYGITAFPTAVLIDREGKVVERFHPKFHPRSPESMELLRQMLDIPADAVTDD